MAGDTSVNIRQETRNFLNDLGFKKSKGANCPKLGLRR
jgi:hypothetical protein